MHKTKQNKNQQKLEEDRRGSVVLSGGLRMPRMSRVVLSRGRVIYRNRKFTQFYRLLASQPIEDNWSWEVLVGC